MNDDVHFHWTEAGFVSIISDKSPRQENAMLSTSSFRLQQSPISGLLSGYWRLVPAQACTLRPEEAGILRVAHGQVWATLAGPHSGPANDWGDVVLHSGQQITLMPGQQLVVEPLGDAVNEPAFFSWEPHQSAGMTPSGAGAFVWRDFARNCLAWFRPARGLACAR